MQILLFIASSGTYPERPKNAAQSQLPVGCLVATSLAVCKKAELHTTLLHPPEVILSGWKMPLSPNFPSDAARDSRGQRPVAVTRPAEAGHSRGIKPSECHKAGSRRG